MIRSAYRLRFSAAAVLLALGTLAAAQANTPLSFPAASIRPSSPTAMQGQVRLGLHIDGAQIHVVDYTLKDYIRIAYQIKPYQVEGPEWLNQEHFDVDATLPDGATSAQVPEMLRTLLSSRFQLTTHTATRKLPVYELVQAAGGSKLEASTAPAPPPDPQTENVDAAGSDRGVSIALPAGATYSLTPDGGLKATNITLTEFADVLSRFLTRPVVDHSGLDGRYDISFPLAPEDYRALLIQAAINSGITVPPEAVGIAASAADSSLFAAMASTGLKLHPTAAPFTVRVVDSIAKNPTAN